MERLNRLKEKVAAGKFTRPLIRQEGGEVIDEQEEMQKMEGGMESLPEETIAEEVLEDLTHFDLSKFTLDLFQLRTQLHIWHLQTKSLAEHKALNEAYDTLLDHTDSFVEAAQGRFKTTIIVCNCHLEPFVDYQPKQMRILIMEKTTVFEQMFDQIEGQDLKNILADIIQGLNKLCYLLSLS